MSHLATDWAIAQRGLRPTTRVVLWALANVHNARTGRCDPSQVRLAEVCEISRSVLNTHLGLLEARGLIRRTRRFDRETRLKRSTFYQLALEAPFGPPATPGEATEQAADSGPPCPETRTPIHVRPAGRTLSRQRDSHRPAGWT